MSDLPAIQSRPSLCIVSKELTEDEINAKGEKSLAKAKKAILNLSTLKSDFALICNRQGMCNERLKMNYQLSEKVYNLIMTKVCNARFGEILANYGKKNHLKNKGKLGLQAKLSEMVNGVSLKKIHKIFPSLRMVVRHLVLL